MLDISSTSVLGDQFIITYCRLAMFDSLSTFLLTISSFCNFLAYQILGIRQYMTSIFPFTISSFCIFLAQRQYMTPAGLEPAIPGSVGRCLIHWATGPDVFDYRMRSWEHSPFRKARTRVCATAPRAFARRFATVRA